MWPILTSGQLGDESADQNLHTSLRLSTPQHLAQGAMGPSKLPCTPFIFIIPSCPPQVRPRSWSCLELSLCSHITLQSPTIPRTINDHKLLQIPPGQRNSTRVIKRHRTHHRGQHSETEYQPEHPAPQQPIHHPDPHQA